MSSINFKIAGSDLARASGALNSAERALRRALDPDAHTITVLHVMTALAMVTLAREQCKHAEAMVHQFRQVNVDQLRQIKLGDLIEEVTR